jgi:hypothetical protein
MVFRFINPEDRIQRIRELCAQAADAKDPDEVREIASQLRVELHRQITYLRRMVVTYRNCVSFDDESDQKKKSA